MEEPKFLDSLFKEKIFRIPDYQRGYAWRREQLKDFWEDLVNLSGDRSHYTGVLTLKQIPDHEIARNTKEFWLVDDHSYHVHHIVDGQQRLTAFIIFLQSFVDFITALPEKSTPNMIHQGRRFEMVIPMVLTRRSKYLKTIFGDLIKSKQEGLHFSSSWKIDGV